MGSPQYNFNLKLLGVNHKVYKYTFYFLFFNILKNILPHSLQMQTHTLLSWNTEILISQNQGLMKTIVT